MSAPVYNLAVVALHPIPYQIPLWSLLGKDPQINLTVFFTGHFEEKWRVSMLEGYEYKFLTNITGHDSPGGRFSRINPTIVTELLRRNYDAVLTQGGYDVPASWLAMLGAKLSGTPAIFRGEMTLSGARPGWRQRLKSAVLPGFFSLHEAIMYTCSGNREVFEHYGVRSEKLFLLPCAVDNARFQHERATLTQQQAAIRAEMGISPGRFVVICTAQMYARKRHMDLLRAFVLLRERGLDPIELIFVGEGDEQAALERFARDHHLDTVHFLGFQNYAQVGRYYAIADMGVLVSEHDPSPKALNEMMNFALPVLVTDTIGTARDLVHEGVNGFRVGVGDVDGMARRIAALATDRDCAARMGQESLRIIGEWSFESDVEAIKQVLARVTGGKQRHRKDGL